MSERNNSLGRLAEVLTPEESSRLIEISVRLREAEFLVERLSLERSELLLSLRVAHGVFD